MSIHGLDNVILCLVMHDLLSLLALVFALLAKVQSLLSFARFPITCCCQQVSTRTVAALSLVTLCPLLQFRNVSSYLCSYTRTPYFQLFRPVIECEAAHCSFTKANTCVE